MPSLAELRLAALVALTALAALDLSCGDGSGTDAPRTSFTVWVFDEGVVVGDPAAPLPNATVAFDAPGGDRVVRTTEADGHVTFEADFARGGAHVSAVSADHALVTMLDASPDTASARPNTFGKAPNDLVIVLPRLDRAIRQASLELRGMLAGKRDAANPVHLSASSLRRLGSDDTKQSSYALRVPRGRPFFLVGIESRDAVESGTTVTVEPLESFRVDLPARDADGTLDIDLSALPALPVRTLQLRADRPEGGSFGPDARASAFVESADSELLVGSFAKKSASADGTGFDLEMTVADIDVSPERLVTRATMSTPDGALSLRSELGIVSDGTRWSDFLKPPIVPPASRTLADPLPLDGLPAGADLRVAVYAGGQLVWILRGPPGGPRQPTLSFPSVTGLLDLTADVQLLAVTIAAEVDRVPLPPHGELYRRVAISPEITLRRR